jgi:ADP-glucose pyrophosphorylase
VVDSVVLGDAVVRSGATVRRAILDERTRVGSGARVGTDDGLTVTRRGTSVAENAVCEPEEKP